MSKGEIFKIYTASAGSGKTYTLVKEFLTLSLSSDYVFCKDILAVTFTNKAANEMKAKILSHLDDLIKNKGDENMKNHLLDTLKIDESVLQKRASDLYDNIIHNYSDFNISTIDSFVQQVSRSFAKELNLPAQYRVLIDDEMLLDGLIQNVDAQIDANDKSLTAILEDFVNFQLDEEDSLRIDVSLRKFVKKLLKENAYKKGELLGLDSNADNNCDYTDIKKQLDKVHKKYKTNVEKGIEKIEEFEKEYKIETSDYNNGSRGGLQTMKTKLKADINTPSVSGKKINAIFSDKNKVWYSSDCVKNKKETLAEINRLGIDVVGMYEQLCEDHKNYIRINIVRRNLYLYALRKTLLSIVSQYVGETNKVHISEFNKRISDILGDCSVPFIYERIGSRYKHFFIDEFQDTSLLQWHNFLPLVNNGLSEGNMSLLVGDAKQAIYRFRSGEVEQIINLTKKPLEIYGAETSDFYDECKENLGKSACNMSLDSNWRSKKNIIEFNNSFFRLSKYRLESEDYRSVYEGFEQKCPKKYPYDGYVSVEIFDMDNFKSKKDAGTKSKPEAGIEEVVEEKKISLEGGSSKLYKDAVRKSMLNDINSLIDKGFKYSDISILVRNGRTDGYDIATYLSQNGIPVISSDSIQLKSSDKVRLVVFTLKYLLDDENNIDKLILSFYNNICADKNPYDVSEALRNKIIIEDLENIRNEAYSLYDLCYRIINKVYKFNVLEDEFLQYFLNHVLEWQNSENGGIDAFIEHWDKKAKELCVKLTSEINAVQIMTIHKSKGLEFKVVMYPYAVTKVPEKFRGNEMWLPMNELQIKDESISGLDSFLLSVNKDLEGTELAEYYTDEVKKTSFDDFNVMYVAMTRAADLMFIYTNNARSSKESGSYSFFVDYFDTKNKKNYLVGDKNVAEKEDVDFVKRFGEPKTSENSVRYELGEVEYCADKDKDKSKGVLELDAEDMPQTLDWVPCLDIEADPTMFWAEGEYRPKEWGDLVHEMLAKVNTAEDVDEILRYYLNDGRIDQQNADVLKKRFEEIVVDVMIKDAYSKDAIVKNEMDILVDDNVMKRIEELKKENNIEDKKDKDKSNILRPDRYVELADRLILIDYKTAKPSKDHEIQMEGYILALRSIGMKKNIEAYLVYLKKDIDEKIEVKPVKIEKNN